MTRAGLALLFVAACGGAAANPDAVGGDAGDGDGGGGVDAAWPGGNSYAHATCPCGFGEACVEGGCVAAPAEYISLSESPGTSIACAYDAGVLAASFMPGPIVGRCQAMTGVAAGGSRTITSGNVTIMGIANEASWPGGLGCVNAAPVTFVDGADVTIAVTPTETFPAAEVTLPTPASPTGTLLPTTVVVGEPLAFAWVPAPDADDTVEIILISTSPEPYLRIRCVDVPDLGAFKIPAELTAMLTGRLDANVAVQRVSREHLSPATASPVSIELTLLRSVDQTIPIVESGPDPPPDAPPAP